MLDGLFHGKSEPKMDDNWGYLYFRKPPYVNMVVNLVSMWVKHGFEPKWPLLVILTFLGLILCKPVYERFIHYGLIWAFNV